MDTEIGINVNTMILKLPFNITREEFESSEIERIIADFVNKEHIFEWLTEIVIIFLYALLMFTGIMTNLIIILVIVLTKKLKTSNNILLINLFVSDLLLCIFCMPFTLISIIRRSWYFGAFMCKLVPFIQAITTFISAATISSIALDRMFQITANQLTGKLRFIKQDQSPKLVKYGYNTIIIWLIALFLASPICVYQKVVEYGIIGLISYDKCVEMWPNNNRGIYSFVILITQLLIPSSVMLFSHYRIRKHLDSARCHKSLDEKQQISNSSDRSNSNKNNIQRETDITEDLPTTSSATVNYQRSQSPNYDQNYFDKELHRNNRITIFLLTITIMFAISWLPWNLFNVYVDFYPDINLAPSELYSLLAICHLIAMSSATTNAIFYGFLHTAIRHELKNIVKRIKSCF